MRIAIIIKGIEILDENEDSATVKAGAGVVWDDLVRFCVEREFYGIENLSLIPGTVGAAPIQNIGAYGTEIADTLSEVEYFDFEKYEKFVIRKEDCNLGYRDSIFKNKLKNKIIVTSVILKLSTKKNLNLGYRALQNEFPERYPENISIYEVREKIIKIRESKLPSTDKFGNAGSFFKNPEISEKEFNKLQHKFPDIVYFETGKDKIKIPAGWLIENAGLKGIKKGNTGTYPKQALVLVNYGNAKGSEIKALAEEIIQQIEYRYGVSLVPEVNII